MINGQGVIVFKAQVKRGELREAGREGIFLFRNGALEKPVRLSDPFPSGGSYATLTPPNLSETGVVVFWSANVGGKSSEGIYTAERR